MIFELWGEKKKKKSSFSLSSYFQVLPYYRNFLLSIFLSSPFYCIAPYLIRFIVIIPFLFFYFVNFLYYLKCVNFTYPEKITHYSPEISSALLLLFIYRYFYLSINLSIYICMTAISIYLSSNLSISIHLSICLFIYLSFLYLYIYLFISIPIPIYNSNFFSSIYSESYINPPCGWKWRHSFKFKKIWFRRRFLSLLPPLFSQENYSQLYMNLSYILYHIYYIIT